jgi:hypothetical protein
MLQARTAYNAVNILLFVFLSKERQRLPFVQIT